MAHNQSLAVSLLSAFLLLISNCIYGQESDTTYWSRTARGNFTFTQVNLNNWAGGGNNSVSLHGDLGFSANYRKGRVTWTNNLDFAYGLVNQGDVGFQKSDDQINFVTKFGLNLSESVEGNLSWTSLLDFRTQFANGFASPEDSVRISTFMAPAYLVLSSGLEYAPNDKLSGKITFVLDDSLSEAGEYGVDPGKRVRAELGSFFRASYSNEVATNVIYSSKLELFTNYVNNFGNIDVNWENRFQLKVNDWLAVRLVAQLIYDDDINIEVVDSDGMPTGEVGPRLQFKQLFGVGISYQVSNRAPAKSE